MQRGAKVAWVLLAFLALENGLGAWRYLLPTVPFPAPLDNFLQHRYLLALHALCGGIALVAGPLQLLPPFRERHWSWHRRMGWVYCLAVALGGVAALRLALQAQTGRVAGSGFFALAGLWLFSTAFAVRMILRGNFVAHRRWMIRSYALTAAAITLRIYLPISILFHWDYSVAYPAIAWLCWVPNALLAEIYLRRSAGPQNLMPRAAMAP